MAPAEEAGKVKYRECFGDERGGKISIAGSSELVADFRARKITRAGRFSMRRPTANETVGRNSCDLPCPFSDARLAGGILLYALLFVLTFPPPLSPRVADLIVYLSPSEESENGRRRKTAYGGAVVVVVASSSTQCGKLCTKRQQHLHLWLTSGDDEADALVQLHLPLAERVHLFRLLVEAVAEGGRLAQYVHLRRPVLVAQVRYLALQLLEQVLQPDAPLPLEVVVQVALLDRVQLVGEGLGGLSRFACDRRIRLLVVEEEWPPADDRLPVCVWPPPADRLRVVEGAVGGGEDATLAPPDRLGTGVFAPEMVVEPAGVG
uniref:Uncharacterized protein n=1 Tax=Anopheles farauti TaxID=69004 RepID=A0A182R0A4_9DIPT